MLVTLSPATFPPLAAGGWGGGGGGELKRYSRKHQQRPYAVIPFAQSDSDAVVRSRMAGGCTWRSAKGWVGTMQLERGRQRHTSSQRAVKNEAKENKQRLKKETTASAHNGTS